MTILSGSKHASIIAATTNPMEMLHERNRWSNFALTISISSLIFNVAPTNMCNMELYQRSFGCLPFPFKNRHGLNAIYGAIKIVFNVILIVYNH